MEQNYEGKKMCRAASRKEVMKIVKELKVINKETLRFLSY